MSDSGAPERGYLHPPGTPYTCQRCGALVLDLPLHWEWHRQLEGTREPVTPVNRRLKPLPKPAADEEQNEH